MTSAPSSISTACSLEPSTACISVQVDTHPHAPSASRMHDMRDIDTLADEIERALRKTPTKIENKLPGSHAPHSFKDVDSGEINYDCKYDTFYVGLSAVTVLLWHINSCLNNSESDGLALFFHPTSLVDIDRSG